MDRMTFAPNMAAAAVVARPCALGHGMRWRVTTADRSVYGFGSMHITNATKRTARHLGSLTT